MLDFGRTRAEICRRDSQHVGQTVIDEKEFMFVPVASPKATIGVRSIKNE